MRVCADGVALTPQAWAPGRWRFALPPRARRLNLLSRVVVPGQFDPALDDRRRLGIALTGVVLDGHAVALDGTLLESGFHAPEGDGVAVWRWTDGDAMLRLPRWWEPKLLDLEAPRWRQYWIKPTARRVSRPVATGRDPARPLRPGPALAS